MPLFIVLFGLFLYVYCEISLLVSVGSTIGVLPLILLMIGISALGLWLLKLRGIVTIWQIRKQLSEGKVPTQAVISSVFFAISGVLFIIPGFLSDIFAILLLLPITRTLFQGWLFNYLTRKIRFFAVSKNFQAKQQNSNIFEAEFEHKQDEDKRLK